MKCIVIILVMLSSAFSIAAQTTDIIEQAAVEDSLKNILSTTTSDTEKVHILFRLSYPSVFSFPDSALKFSLQGLGLAEQIGIKEDQIKLLVALALALSYKGNLFQALKTSFSALELAEKLRNKDLITMCFFCIGSIYFY